MHIHILHSTSSDETFAEDQPKRQVNFRLNFSTATLVHRSLYFLKVQFIWFTESGRVVSSSGARSRLYYRDTYTSSSILAFVYRTYWHKGTLYTYTRPDTHVFVRQAGAHLLRHVFPVTVLISLIENTNTALTCSPSIYHPYISTVSLKSRHFHGNWHQPSWRNTRRRGREKRRGMLGRAETGLIQDETYVSYH